MLIGGGLFRDGIRGATAVIGLALISRKSPSKMSATRHLLYHTHPDHSLDVETQLRDGSLHRTALHREPLKQVVRALLAVAAERTRGRGGETNVKGHMFLSLVLAQVEAMEEEGTVEEGVVVAVARAARDSLEVCEELLSGVGVGAPGEDEDGWMGVEGFGLDGFGGEFAWESFFSGGGFC